MAARHGHASSISAQQFAIHGQGQSATAHCSRRRCQTAASTAALCGGGGGPQWPTALRPSTAAMARYICNIIMYVRDWLPTLNHAVFGGRAIVSSPPPFQSSVRTLQSDGVHSSSPLYVVISEADTRSCFLSSCAGRNPLEDRMLYAQGNMGAHPAVAAAPRQIGPREAGDQPCSCQRDCCDRSCPRIHHGQHNKLALTRRGEVKSLGEKCSTLPTQELRKTRNQVV